MKKEFLEYLRNDMVEKREFASLPSQKKIELLNKNGARIADDVVIGKGTYFICEKLEIGKKSFIGENCIFDCNEIKLGKLVRIGNNCKFEVNKLEIGDVLYAADDILIDGNPSNKRAVFKIGKCGFIGEDALIQASKEVLAGDNVCIGARVIVHAHGHWQNSLEGYYNAEAGITIDDNVWIGSNVVLLPGVRMGARSTITVGSTVSFDIPQNSLCAGNPAKIIQSNYPKKLKYGEKINLLKKFSDEIAIILLEKGFGVEKREEGIYHIQKQQKKWNIIWYDISRKKDSSEDKKIIISIKEVPEYKNSYIFNLKDYTLEGKFDLLCDEIREFLRRKGIKFRQYLWRYKWMEYDE